MRRIVGYSSHPSIDCISAGLSLRDVIIEDEERRIKPYSLQIQLDILIPIKSLHLFVRCSPYDEPGQGLLPHERSNLSCDGYYDREGRRSFSHDNLISHQTDVTP